MSYKNDLTLEGDIASDITLRYIGDKGTAKAFFLLNVPRTFKGETKDHKIPCVAWSELAETISNSFAKNSHVTVHGMVEFGRYKDKDDNWKDDIHALAFNVTGESMGNEIHPDEDSDGPVPF